MSRRMRQTLVGTLAALCMAVAPAAAQAPQRDGFWLGVGGGAGSAIRCEECAGEARMRGGVVTIEAGWAPSERLLYGVDVTYWGKSFARAGTEQTLELYNFSFTALLFPSERAGFFLKGGVGFAYADTEFRDDAGTSTLSDSGFGAIAGMGYDIPLGRRIAVTPAVSYMFGVTADSIKHDVFAATLALTLR